MVGTKQGKENINLDKLIIPRIRGMPIIEEFKLSY